MQSHNETQETQVTNRRPKETKERDLYYSTFFLPERSTFPLKRFTGGSQDNTIWPPEQGKEEWASRALSLKRARDVHN